MVLIAPFRKIKPIAPKLGHLNAYLAARPCNPVQGAIGFISIKSGQTNRIHGFHPGCLSSISCIASRII